MMYSGSHRNEGLSARNKDGINNSEKKQVFRESSNKPWKAAVVLLIILLIIISTALAVVVVLNKDKNKPEPEQWYRPIEEISENPLKGFTKATRTWNSNDTATDEVGNAASINTKGATTSKTKVPEKTVQEVCFTRECTQAANSLISNMDLTIDPCEDFQKFVCGKYDYNNEISQGSKMHGKLGQMYHKMNRDIKVILEEPIQSGDFKGMTIAKKFYKSCLTQNLQKEEGKSEPLLDEFVKLFGDWPALLDKWKSPVSYSWEKLVAHLMTLDIDSIIKVEVIRSYLQNNESVIHINAPEISPNFFDEFEKVIHKKTALKDLKDLRNMQRAMAQVPVEKTYARTHIRVLKSEFPKVDWDSIFSIFPSDVQITDHDVILISSWKQFKNVVEVLLKSPIRVVQNYIYYTLWKYTGHLWPNSARESPQVPLWKLCVMKATKYFENIVSAAYVERHLDVEQVDAVERLAEEIRFVLIETMQEADWLDEKTLSNALAKVNKMNLKIGHPEHLFNETFLMQGYEKVIIQEDDYAKNTLMLSRMLVRKNLNSLRKVVRRDAWPAPPVTINAFYDTLFNEMIFPAAILRFPAFNDKVPAYLNYGRIGMIIGHEMSHGFDYNGHNFNEHGQLEKWWSNDTLEKFIEKTQCFMHQFNNIADPITNTTINGNQTVSENMADTGGLKLAYTAFTKLLSNQPIVPTLPGLDQYNPKQLFFIVFANFWCNIYIAKYREYLLKEDTHSLARYRVNYSLKNLPAFADAFNCSESAKMRPKTRCELW